MNPFIATLVYVTGIAGLFYLDRNASLRTSKALWLPVVWISIVGSRAVSVWFNMSPADSDVQMDGSPLDRVVFALLLVGGLVVLVNRGRKSSAALKANWPILAYFAFCLVSVVWSDFPDVAAKRWIKAIGDLVMVLIIVTDGNPIGALKRVLARAGFILLPASVLLIKYFPGLGRGYDPWFGMQSDLGVTTNKNTLGVITFILSLGALWRVLELFRAKGQPNRRRHLVAQFTLLAFGMALLAMANSATSLASFALGSVLLVAGTLRAVRRHPGAIHALVLTMVAAGGLSLVIGGTAGIAHVMGRKGDLTGRTEIWSALIPMAPNSVVGAGFESFWLGPRLEAALRDFPGLPLNEAHNGYLEVYLNLGFVGVFLIALILVTGYGRAVATFRRDPLFGSLLLAYIASAAVYSFTEAGFRMLDPIWIFLLYAVVAASAAAPRREAVPVERFGAPADRFATSSATRSAIATTMMKK
ncbi:MAG: O-antigen ligase family protein [Candidatus Acidiferrales bacterium]